MRTIAEADSLRALGVVALRDKHVAIFDETVSTEIVGAATRFKIYTYEADSSWACYLSTIEEDNNFFAQSYLLGKDLSSKTSKVGELRRDIHTMLTDEIRYQGRSEEYESLVRRLYFIENSLQDRFEYIHEAEQLKFMINAIEEDAKARADIKEKLRELNACETDVQASQERLEKFMSSSNGRNEKEFYYQRMSGFKEMAFKEIDNIVKSDFVQGKNAKFSWRRAIYFLLSQSVNVFGGSETNESSSISPEVGANILDYIATRLVDRGAYQTLVDLREQITNFILQFEVKDQAKLRAGLIKNYLVDQYNFIAKMGTSTIDVDPHTDMLAETLVFNSEGTLDVYDQVWEHWTQLLILKSGKSDAEKSLAVKSILNSPLLDRKRGILRPRYINPAYSAYQHATLFLLAARGLNQTMANVMRPWVISESQSRKKMGGVAVAMMATVARNPGIDRGFANHEWMAEPPSGKMSDTRISFTAEVLAGVINHGVQLTEEEMQRLIAWTITPNDPGWS